MNFFTGMPELADRPGVRGFWEKLEKMIFPRLKYVITVNDSIAGLYRELYGNELLVVRNVPPLRNDDLHVSRAEMGLPEGCDIVLLQGAWINVDRGGEEAVEAMRYLDGVLLLVIGGGDVIDKLRARAAMPELTGKVRFIGRQPFDSLYRYTILADIGLSLDKDTNINYRFSLPNKLFDYIHAGVPVLVSDLPEVRKIVETYQVGCVLGDLQPETIATAIRGMLDDRSKLAAMRSNCLRAKTELCREKELEKVKALYRGFL